VEVHEDPVGLAAQVGQQGVDLAERGARGVEEHGARQVHHREPACVALHHRHAAARIALRIVGRAHDPLLAVEVVVDVALLVGVVAEGDRVDAVLEPGPRDLLVDAEAAGGVLAVHHEEVRLVAAAQLGHHRLERAPARASNHVADEHESHSPRFWHYLCPMTEATATERTLVLEAHEISKRFGEREALKRVSLEAARGELVAIIGPNGAGKTTLLSILAGIQRADGGSVSRPPGEIGWVPQQAAVYSKLTVAENLRLFARLEKRPDVEETVERMLAQTGLEQRRDDPVSQLSGGNKQRVNIAIGLLSAPDVLLLDEPSAALDPRQRERLWEFIRELAARGTTVIYSTHNVHEVERHAGQVVVLADGELLFAGTPRELEQIAGATDLDFEEAFVAFLRQRGH